jgi:hypothetical protein
MPLGRPVLRAGVLLAVASAGALLVSRLSSTPAPAPAQLEQRRLSPAASLMIDRMARSILQGGAGRDEDEMGSQIENWARAVHAATLMQHPGNARTQMLAMPDRRMEEMHRGRFGSSLAGDRLCARLRRV